MFFRQLLNPETSSFTYVISDPGGHLGVLLDPEVGMTERDLKAVSDAGLDLVLVLLTCSDPAKVEAAQEIRNRTGATVLSAGGITAGANGQVRGGDVLSFGTSPIEVLDTPGFREDAVSYRIGRRVFTGGALSVRHCRRDDRLVDPGKLYDSIVGVLFTLPDDTLVYPGHHSGGVQVTTIGAERRYNPLLAPRDRRWFLEAFERERDDPAPLAKTRGERPRSAGPIGGATEQGSA